MGYTVSVITSSEEQKDALVLEANQLYEALPSNLKSTSNQNCKAESGSGNFVGFRITFMEYALWAIMVYLSVKYNLKDSPSSNCKVYFDNEELVIVPRDSATEKEKFEDDVVLVDSDGFPYLEPYKKRKEASPVLNLWLKQEHKTKCKVLAELRKLSARKP